jgi:hypothetical protein
MKRLKEQRFFEIRRVSKAIGRGGTTLDAGF